MTAKPKVGLITFGDHREHEWSHVFKALAEPRHKKLVDYLKTLPIELLSHSDVARHKEEIDAQTALLRQAGAEVLIAYTPCWTSPNLGVRGIQAMNLPTVVYTTIEPGTHGSVGMMGLAGALAQIGVEHLRVRENPGPAFEAKVLPYVRAASAVKNLRGKEFGIFGGRSLGIDTATMDPMQWRALFGVDVEHVDQLEIITRAKSYEGNPRVDKFFNWLTGSVKGVHYEDNFTEEKLKFQVACHLAVKDLTAERKFDFIGIKCMPDLATDYVPQCLSAALMGEAEDAEGPKKRINMGCEADADGALTMEILTLVSGGHPYFGDVSHIYNEEKIIALPNCGAFCTWWAARSEKVADNLKQVELRPSIRRGGGGIPIFTAKEGPITMARLYRKDLEYYMAIIPAEAVRLTPAQEAEFAKSRGKHQLPLMYAKIECDPDNFLAEFGSNHISAVGGDCAAELLHFCELSGVTPVLMDANF